MIVIGCQETQGIDGEGVLTIEIVVTAKIKLLPTPEQATQLDNTLNAVRDGLNHASKIAYNNNLLSGFKKLQKLVYTELRNTFGLKSQMACNVCSVVAGSYASMKLPALKVGRQWRVRKEDFEKYLEGDTK